MAQEGGGCLQGGRHPVARELPGGDGPPPGGDVVIIEVQPSDAADTLEALMAVQEHQGLWHGHI